MVDKQRIENAVKEILYAIGEDPDREGLVETPKRVANMYAEVFAGLQEEPEGLVKLFKEDFTDEIIVVRDITVYSMCEHHLLPFYGVAHIAYIADHGQVLGLSKLARIVDHFAKKPQLQERLGDEISSFIMKATGAKAVAVMIEAEHMCMTMRGVSKPGAKTITTSYKGVLKHDLVKRNEVLSLLR